MKNVINPHLDIPTLKANTPPEKIKRSDAIHLNSTVQFDWR